MPAGSAPALRTTTRSSACWIVNCPWMIPESPIRALMLGAELHPVVQDDGQGPADVRSGDLFETASAVGGKSEGNGRIAPLVGSPADHPQVLAADGCDLFDQVDAGMPSGRVAPDDFGVIRDRSAEGLKQGRLILGRTGFDQLPFQDGRDLDQILDPLGIVHSGELDHDLVLPLALDERLGYAELVDAVPDGLHCLDDGLVLEKGHGRRLQGKRDPVGHERSVPVAGVLRDQVPGLDLLIHIQAGEDEAARLFLGRGREPDGVFLEQVGESDDFLVGFAVEGVVGHDLEDQMDASLEIQAELDFSLSGRARNRLRPSAPSVRSTFQRSPFFIGCLFP